MLKVRYSAQFKRDFKLAKKRGLPMEPPWRFVLKMPPSRLQRRDFL